MEAISQTTGRARNKHLRKGEGNLEDTNWEWKRGKERGNQRRREKQWKADWNSNWKNERRGWKDSAVFTTPLYTWVKVWITSHNSIKSFYF